MEKERVRYYVYLILDARYEKVRLGACVQDAAIRGKLHGIKMITSDAHKVLKAAIRAVFRSEPWQRCQFHLQQNAQAYIAIVSLKKEVATDDEANRLLK